MSNPAQTPTPSPPNPRNIIILLDGTANQFSETNTNLIKTLSVIRADEAQLVYYSSGVGTVLPEGTSTWGHLRQKAAEYLDMGLAWNFDEFVCDAYKYLMDYYKTGDKIYLFGFSRGAYTARALAGMIQRVGLLPAGMHNQVALAYEMYTGPDKQDSTGKMEDPCVLYRRIFGRSRPVSIEFMGVWDTVSSIGGFDLPMLPFAGGSKSIKFFRHALALDERRARFAPEYWRHDAEETSLLSEIKGITTQMKAHPGDKSLQGKKDELGRKLAAQYPSTEKGVDGRVWEKIVECWFMGCHSDVGGGNTRNDEPSLSNIPFRWMLREAVRCGLLLDPEGIARQTALHIPHNHSAEVDDKTIHTLTRLRELLKIQATDPRQETEQEDTVEKLRQILIQGELAKIVEIASEADGEDTGDKVVLSEDEKAGIHESLTGAWLVVEGLVLKTRKYTKEGIKNEDDWKINRGQGRQIVPGQKCHRSVLRRLIYDAHNSATEKDYKGPEALVADGWPTWDEVRKGGKEVKENHIWLD